jgi:hypothetical protein
MSLTLELELDPPWRELVAFTLSRVLWRTQRRSMSLTSSRRSISFFAGLGQEHPTVLPSTTYNQPTIMDFCEDRAILGFLGNAKMNQWLSFWSKQIHHFAWYFIIKLGLFLDEEAFKPNINMYETAHPSMWITQGNKR